MMLNLESRNQLDHYRFMLEQKTKGLMIAANTLKYESAVNQVLAVNQIISTASIDETDLLNVNELS